MTNDPPAAPLVMAVAANTESGRIALETIRAVRAENPEDLGGEIEFGVGGQPLTFATTTGLFVPKGLKHGPLIWKKVRGPHIQMALMLNCGDVKEGWADSGISGPTA